MNRKAGSGKAVADREPDKKTTAETTGEADAFDHWLEDKLRNAYSSVLEEPIPEDLLKLLQQKLKD